MMITAYEAKPDIPTSLLVSLGNVNRIPLASLSGMPQQHVLSPSAHARLKAELEELTGEGRIEIAKKIEAARALGDLSENGDYHAAKDQQGQMEARIRTLQAILIDAVIVDATGEDDVVGVGSVVGIRFEGDDDVEQYLVGHIEERHDTYEVVSPGSPLGEALMGKTPGDKAGYEINGNTVTVEIVSVGTA
jgi:transcription elongation factor GreA